MQAIDPHIHLESWLSTCANLAILEVIEGRWRFGHDKLRAGILASLKEDELSELHRKVATALELNDDLEAQVQMRTAELTRANLELQEALDNINTLQKLIPICANCKNIRDDEGFWKQVEVYFSEQANTSFSHGICPDCSQKLYPEIFKGG